MSPEQPTFRRDLFEIENARNLTRDELVGTFVPTKSFWRLLSAKNQIILGARGSGKTALAKMLSHDHLSRLGHDRARAAVESKSFIGIYLPTSVEWVGSLKNKPWQTESEAEEFFQWRLNISTTLAFLITVRSCLDTYCDNPGTRARAESEISKALAEAWLPNYGECDTIRHLQHAVEDIEHKKQQQLARFRALGRLAEGEEPAGLGFATELFGPLRRGIQLVGRVLEFPAECTWLLCLDEAEFLEPSHHRILNTYLRSDSGNLTFKLTTMPYKHYTRATNTALSLNVGHDFEYVYIDQDPVLPSGRRPSQFATKLFRKRAELSGPQYQNVTLLKLLGDSTLLDRKTTDWAADSANFVLLREYATADTLERAERLRGNPQAFQDQIVRKLHGALLLRHALGSQKGRSDLDVFSGARMLIRCSDANPRRLIRLFNSVLLEAQGEGLLRNVSKKAQNRILTAFSASTLLRVQSEPECGRDLYRFLMLIGTFMHSDLVDRKLSTDQVSSVVVDDTVSDEEWDLVQNAVGLGLLFPNLALNSGDEMPERSGVFHLAYVLAPYFQILPRRGTARSLRTVIDVARSNSILDGQLSLFDPTRNEGGPS
jgi:hypothetical protein